MAAAAPPSLVAHVPSAHSVRSLVESNEARAHHVVEPFPLGLNDDVKLRPTLPAPEQRQNSGLLMRGTGEPSEESTATLVVQRIVSGEKNVVGGTDAPSKYASAEQSDSYKQRAALAMPTLDPPSLVAHAVATHSVQSIIRANETAEKNSPLARAFSSHPAVMVPAANTVCEVDQKDEIDQKDEQRGLPRFVQSTHTHLNKQMEHVMRKITNINAEMDQIVGQPPLSRVHVLQDNLAEVETYKGADGIWLGSLASKHIHEGQATMQEAFETTSARLRALVERLKDEAEPSSQSIDLAAPMGADSSEGFISAVLMPTYNTLVNTAAQFRVYIAKKGVLSEEELVHFYWLQFELNHVESTFKHEGVWAGDLQHGFVPAGQACVQEQVELCHTLAHRINTAREIYCQTKSTQDLKPKNRRAITIWREMKLVSPSLRPVYRSLVDCTERLAELSRRLHLGANSACSQEVEQLCEHVHSIETKYKHNGIWVVLAQTEETEVHSAPWIPREVGAGQALLNRVMDSFEDHLDRLRKKDAAQG